jgi:hypothetical protein
MVSMFGRGFDSRQLHDQAKSTHPRKGAFCFLGDRCKLACIRPTKNKKSHVKRGVCFLFAGLKLRDGEQSEHSRF